MNRTLLPTHRFCLGYLFAFFILQLTPTLSFSKSEHPSASVFSEIADCYERQKLENGTWEPETFAFAKGIILNNEVDNGSLEALSFYEIARVLAKELQRQQYIPSLNREKTKLLIRVNWGLTIPWDDGLGEISFDGLNEATRQYFDSSSNSSADAVDTGSLSESDKMLNEQIAMFEEYEYDMALTQSIMLQQMSQHERDRANSHNARILGYTDELLRIKSFNLVPAFQGDLSNLLSEIESPRYFVVLEAYDFQKIRTEKTRKLLWVTRFSIRAKGKKFDEELAYMAAAAARSFGQETKQLKRYQRPPKVIFGELEYLGVEE